MDKELRKKILKETRDKLETEVLKWTMYDDDNEYRIFFETIEVCDGDWCVIYKYIDERLHLVKIYENKHGYYFKIRGKKYYILDGYSTEDILNSGKY